MKFKQRLAYYLGGFSIGMIILFFFLGGKGTSCAYGPEARVIKNLNLKKKTIGDKAWQAMARNQIDTAMLFTIIRGGDVLFSESNTSLDSCKQYVLAGKSNLKNIKVRVENCENYIQVLTVDKID